MVMGLMMISCDHQRETEVVDSNNASNNFPPAVVQYFFSHFSPLVTAFVTFQLKPQFKRTCLQSSILYDLNNLKKHARVNEFIQFYHVFGDDAVNGDEHRLISIKIKGLGFMVRGTGSATVFRIIMSLVYFCINTAGLAEVNGKQVPKQRKIYAFRSKL
ncbi:hypothetical protein GQX74_008764 [Glossina fuscipes]|nr:hypothetical protein GQX74_008764 [Glossina fuscipes]